MKKNYVINFVLIFYIISFLLSCTAEKTDVSTNEKNNKIAIDNTHKVFLITLDGLRWQELFTGADSLLINSSFTKNKEFSKENFWDSLAENRRKKLLPFFWSTIKEEGQIYGNRNFKNKVNLSNNYWFSYPGYSEILCGFADNDSINTNDKINNRNVTVLEKVNNLPEYKNKVSAFASWDVFPYIINEQRSSIYVNAGYRKAKGKNLTSKEKFLNQLQDQAIQPWSTVRQDVFTHNYALEFIKKETPKLIYISYGETDDFAHDGNYDHYLLSARNTDNMIKELWDYCQNTPFYKDNTTFIITTDHGRGTLPLENWMHHGNNLKYDNKSYTIEGSDETWIAVFGKNIKNKGEVKTDAQLYNNQIASTIIDFLKVDLDTKTMGKSLLQEFN